MKSKILKILGLLFFIFLLYVLSCNVANGYEFENELKGSTGWGTVELNMRKSANNSSTVVATVPKGEAFLILSESGNYWQIKYNNKQGYVEHNYCMINLPDVMPSIIYNISNASSSIYKSSGVDLPDVTRKKLYSTGKVMNNKIGIEEYPCPILYSTAKKIAVAQKSALKDGYCLKIYDSYRPRSVSKLIAQKLNIIYSQNSTVKNNINYSTGKSGTRYYWGQSWFLAQGLSSHNTGAAIDVTLCYNSTKKECTMPTAMHELSTKAIKYYSGSCLKVPANYSKEMTAEAKKLDNYMTSAGMATLSSEWWHFQEQDGYNRIRTLTNGNGCDFQIKGIVSEPNATVSDITLSQDDNYIYYTVKFNKNLSNINKSTVPTLKVKIGNYNLAPIYEKNTNNSITYKSSNDVKYEGNTVNVVSLSGGNLKANLKLPKTSLGTISYTSPKVKNIEISGINDDYIYVSVKFNKNIVEKAKPTIQMKVGNDVKFMTYYKSTSNSIEYRMQRDKNKKCYRIEFMSLIGGNIVANDSGGKTANLSFNKKYIATIPGKDSTFDVNNDNKITATDAHEILLAYSTQAAGGAKADLKYDVDGDGSVTISDATYVLSYYSLKSVTPVVK